ncbi:MAG: hypothetical protein M0Z35_21755 [Desulfitobacterium hafniense]|nr:hypothetical protein [Desulfitobacterium hafniense]
MILDKIISKFKKNPHLANKISNIGLSDRTYHIVRRQGIDTVGDLVKLSWKDISGMRRSTRGTCEEVEKVLGGMGLGLRKDDNN